MRACILFTREGKVEGEGEDQGQGGLEGKEKVKGGEKGVAMKEEGKDRGEREVGRWSSILEGKGGETALIGECIKDIIEGKGEGRG